MRCVYAGLLVLWMLVVALSIEAGKPIDYDALEQQWEKGDMDEELLSEEALAVKQKRVAKEELEKSEMVFVTLHAASVTEFAEAHPDADKPLSELCAHWKQMLRNGGLDVTFYELEETKVLAGLQKGSRVKELQAFLFEQPQVAEIQWNQETMYPPSSQKAQKKPRRKRPKKMVDERREL
ncbi:hypothetical protein ACHHYP_17260 [Achlya hypogyna]|uniref:Secreted protein n=1 Tax=Achlya hypogyna TaxID=1202772 RepID=A0A1V9Y4S1_ACHHY|nr:hypothetical protein ACHHYP_17260 [Achlya hypogyna]